MNINWYSIKFLPDNKFVKSVAIWLFILPSLSKTFKNLPFSWYSLFFAALCFAIANMIYMIKCPAIIKNHISFVGFVGDRKTSIHLKEYQKEIKDTDITIIDNQDNDENLLRNTFWEIHQKAKIYQPRWSKLCYLFYAFGFMCIVIAIGYQTYNIIAFLKILLKK